MVRTAKMLLLVVGLALVVPALPATAEAATEQVPPHVRRRRYVPPPPPPPPHVRRRVIHHHHTYAPAPRPRQPIAADPVTSIYFGLGPVGNFLVENDDRISQVLDSGGGLELFLGFRFSRFAAFELGGLFTFHGTEDPLVDIETGSVNAFTGDIKIFFLPSSRRIEPFLQLGAGAYLLSRDGWSGNEMTGGGFQAGGGVDIRLNEMVAIGTRFLYRGAFLDNSEAVYWTGALYENAFLNMFTLSANLQLHF